MRLIQLGSHFTNKLLKDCLQEEKKKTAGEQITETLRDMGVLPSCKGNLERTRLQVLDHIIEKRGPECG